MPEARLARTGESATSGQIPSVGKHDYDIVRQMLYAMGSDGEYTDRRLLVAIPGTPMSKNRARFVNGHAYTPAATRDEEERVASHFKHVQPFQKNVAVACLFYRHNRQRLDVDNMIKLVLDAMTKAGVWEDDYLVTGVAGRVELDRCNPRTVVGVGFHPSTLERGTNMEKECFVCGKSFRPTSLLATTCSRTCGITKQAKLKTRKCAKCSTEFKPGTSYTKFCGVECRQASLRGTRKPKIGRVGHCQDCGVEVSKPDYLRCRACWVIARNRDGGKV